MGIAAWAVKYSTSVTIVYSLVISVLSIVLFFATLIALIAKPSNPIPFAVITVLDIIFAFLWISSFILLANDYNRIGCRHHAWGNGEFHCNRKYTAEAFAFIAFFFTLAAIIFEVLLLWAMAPSKESHHHHHHNNRSHQEKAVHQEQYRPDRPQRPDTGASSVVTGPTAAASSEVVHPVPAPEYQQQPQQQPVVNDGYGGYNGNYNYNQNRNQTQGQPVVGGMATGTGEGNVV